MKKTSLAQTLVIFIFESDVLVLIMKKLGHTMQISVFCNISMYMDILSQR